MVRFGVRFEHLRPIELRIKGNGQEMPVSRAALQSEELLLSFFEITREPRAERRERTAREEKRDRERVSFELGG